VFCLKLVRQNNLAWDIQANKMEGGVEELVENTTVIAVNIADQADGEGDRTGSLLRPGEPVTRTNSNRSANDSRENILKGKKLGHRRVKDGEVTFKKFETTQLMGSIQLGIQQSVGNLASQEDRDLLHEDFYTVETVVFSRDGSLQKTPAHNFSQFKFRTFAPLAFRKFRNIFEIERDKFLVSLCADPMIELSNPGASGSIFYVTQDDEIICKTVSHKESGFLQEILPAYYLNLHQNIRTLLPKFFGFYCYSCNTKNVRIIVMKNLLPSGLEMHHKFDLKGSTYKRKASRKERSKANPTFKDLDFMTMYPEGILLQPELYHSLMDTIERDCRALESLKIMDYSFLMGVHNVDQAGTKKPLMAQMQQTFFGESGPRVRRGEYSESEGSESGGDDVGEGGGHKKPAMLERIGSFQQKQRLIAHSTALESITAEVDDAAMTDMMEEADTVDMCSTWGGIPAKNHKGENLLIFIGIIDILQSFGMAKKLEHTWKSLIHDGDTVSVHRPSFYAQRFKKFMAEQVFRKMPPNLKPALSFRRSQTHYKRTISRDPAEIGEKDRGRVERNPVPDTAGAVTVITIGSEQQDGQGILPAVLRDKPRVSTTSSPSTGPGSVQLHKASSQRPPVLQLSAGRPDVADVEGVACTPPPDLGVGGITSGDERVQIYVPSPQSTPYSTISKQVADSHKSITFLNYRPDSSAEGDMSPLHSTHESLASQSHTECSVNRSEDTVNHTSQSYMLEETKESLESTYSFQQEVSSTSHQFSSLSTQVVGDSLVTQSVQVRRKKVFLK